MESRQVKSSCVWLTGPRTRCRIEKERRGIALAAAFELHDRRGVRVVDGPPKQRESIGIQRTPCVGQLMRLGANGPPRRGVADPPPPPAAPLPRRGSVPMSATEGGREPRYQTGPPDYVQKIQRSPQPALRAAAVCIKLVEHGPASHEYLRRPCSNRTPPMYSACLEPTPLPAQAEPQPQRRDPDEPCIGCRAAHSDRGRGSMGARGGTEEGGTRW